MLMESKSNLYNPIVGKVVYIRTPLCGTTVYIRLVRSSLTASLPSYTSCENNNKSPSASGTIFCMLFASLPQKQPSNYFLK